MQPFNPLLETRRQFLLRTGNGIGAAALSTMLNPSLIGSAMGEGMQQYGGLPSIPHFPGKAKRVIYMFMAGGPSHIDLFDYKPIQRKLHGTELPDSVRQDQRLTGMSSGQKSFPCVAPMFEFGQYGEHQTWVNKDLLPHTAGVVDKITIMKSLHTEAVNHDPAITFINTGAQQQGKPSMGAWLSYGMGSVNENMPGYVVMISRGRGQLQALYDRLWGSGFLPAKHQGVKLRSAGEPVLYLKNPKGFDREARRGQLDSLEQLNELNYDKFADPEIQARISQYELAFRMQSEVPGLMDIEGEPDHVKELYGPQTDKPGSFARNCLLARRMAEKGVRYIQLFHRGWDQHGALPSKIRQQCEDIDQPAAALIKDLDQRGMLEDTLVVFGGEFGRTPMSEKGTGRDHNPTGFTMWMAGGGVNGGQVIGATDELGLYATENRAHVHDIHASILHLLGLDRLELSYNHQGRLERPTVNEGKMIQQLIS